MYFSLVPPFKVKVNNPLWKHCTLEHGGEKVEFTMTALGSFRSCLKRQVNESVRISSSQADILLNSKSEFHQAPLTRLVAFTGLHNDQGEEQAGQVFPGVGEAGAGGRARAGRRLTAWTISSFLCIYVLRYFEMFNFGMETTWQASQFGNLVRSELDKEQSCSKHVAEHIV